MQLGKLHFSTILLISLLNLNINNVWADGGTRWKKVPVKDSVITKLDSSVLLPAHLMEFSDLIPLETDETIKDRLSCLKSDIPLEYNAYVRGFIDYFTIRNRKYTRRMLERENLYFPLF